jgi:tetratricopeptide (TPR) repeat protein
MREKKIYIFLLTLVFSFLNHTILLSQSQKEIKLIANYTNEKDLNIKFDHLLKLGYYYKSTNLEKADSLKHIILRESRQYDDSIRFAALLYSAEIELIQGNQEEYFKDILSCQPFLNTIKSKDVQFTVYRHIGYYHSCLLEFDQAKFYLKQAIQVGKELRNNGKIAEAYAFLGLNYMRANLKDSALICTNNAIQFGRRSSNKGILAFSFNIQAQIYAFFGQVELSVAKNLLSLELAKDLNDIGKMALYSREIGESQRIILNLDDAETFLKASLSYSKQIHDNRQMALALSSLGSVYKERKEYTKAVESNERAISILIKLHDNNGLGDAHNNLGIIYREQKLYDIAASNFNTALVYYESTANRERIASVYHNVGIVFQKKKKFDIALNYLQRSVEIRKQFGAQNQVFYTYRIISEVYAEIGKSKESLKYLQMYVAFADDNSSIQASTKIAELSERYHSEQREKVISMQADSIQRQIQEKALTATKLEVVELKSNMQRYFIIGFILVVAFGGIITFYRWNQSKLLQQQKESEMSQTLLRSQMNPHFVFNAMSVIQSYIYENDIKNSSKFLVNFSRLMRLILENSPKELIPITTEHEILQKYLETQKLRFEDRFDFEINVDEQLSIDGAMIPPMITQPFIENAIEHGQLHTVENGHIHIHFTQKGNMLHIQIEDNGIGRKNSAKNKKSKEHTSMALNITKERINNLNKKYKTDGFMEIEDYDKINETGTRVLISLPYQVDSNSVNQ